MRNLLVAFTMGMASVTAMAASVVGVEDYKSHLVSFEDDSIISISVEGDEYESDVPVSFIKLTKVNDELYVATQEFIYRTLPHDINHVQTKMKDSAEAIVTKGQSNFVTVLAPAGLNVVAKKYKPRYTCMAYWTGYVVDPATGACMQKGRSGCSNPFQHKTLESCQASL